jgi:hypothetical protein
LSILAGRAVRASPFQTKAASPGEEPTASFVSPSHDVAEVLFPLTPDGDALAALTV